MLLAHLARPQQWNGKHRLKPIVACNLAADITNDPAKIGPKLPQRPISAFELLGVGVPLVLHQSQLADPHIGLPQPNAVFFAEPNLAHTPDASAWRRWETPPLSAAPWTMTWAKSDGLAASVRIAIEALLNQRREFLITHT